MCINFRVAVSYLANFISHSPAMFQAIPKILLLKIILSCHSLYYI